MLKLKISPKVAVNYQLNLVEDHEHQLNTLDDDLQRCNMLRHSFRALVLAQISFKDTSAGLQSPDGHLMILQTFGYKFES